MPAQLVNTLAQRTGKTIIQVETEWNKAQEIALEKLGTTNDRKYWPLVTSITKKRLGLEEASTLSEVMQNYS